MDYLGLVVESARRSLVNPIKNTKWPPRNGLNNGLVLDQVGESVWNPRPNVYRYGLRDHYNAGNGLKKQSSPRDVQFAKDTSGNYLVFRVEKKDGRTQYCPVRKGSSAKGYCIDGLDNALFAVTAGHRDWRNMSVRDIRIARGVLTVTMENSMGKDSYAIIRINDDGVKLVEDVVNGKHGLVIDRLSDLIGSKYMIPIESTDDVGNSSHWIDVDEGRRSDTFGHIDDNDVFHFDYKKWCLRIARQIVGTVREMVDAQLKTADKDSTGVVELLPGLAIEITDGTVEDVSVALNNPSNCRNWIVKPLADELRSHDALAHSGRQKRGHIGYEFAKDFISGTFDPSGCLFKIHISKGFEDPDRPVYESVFNPRPSTRVVLWDDYAFDDNDSRDWGDSWRMFLKHGIDNLHGNGAYIAIREMDRWCVLVPSSNNNGPLFHDLRDVVEAVCSDWRDALGFTITLDRGALEVYAHGPQQRGATYTIIGLNKDGVNLLDAIRHGEGHGILIDIFNTEELIGSKYMIPIKSDGDVGCPRETDVDESDDGNSAKVKDWSYLEDEGYYWRDDGIAPIEGMIVMLEELINRYFHPLKYRIIPHVDRIEIIVKSVRKRGTWPVPMPSYQRCTDGVNAILGEGHALGWECVGPYPSEFGNPPGGEDYILRHLKDKYGAMESAFSQDDGEGPALRFTLKSQDPKKVYGRDATAEELQDAEPADDLRNEMDEFGSI